MTDENERKDLQSIIKDIENVPEGNIFEFEVNDIRAILKEARQQGIEIGIEIERNNQIWKHKKLEDLARQESYEQGKKDGIKLCKCSEVRSEAHGKSADFPVQPTCSCTLAERERIIKLLENEHLGREDILSQLKGAKEI